MRPLVRRIVERLTDLGYLEAERDFEEWGTHAFRYRVGDPALRMYNGLILPNESACRFRASRIPSWRS